MRYKARFCLQNVRLRIIHHPHRHGFVSGLVPCMIRFEHFHSVILFSVAMTLLPLRYAASANQFGDTWLKGRVAALQKKGDGGFPPSPAVLPFHEVHKFWQEWDCHYLPTYINRNGPCVLVLCVHRECGVSYATIEWLQSGVVKPSSQRRTKVQRPRRRGVGRVVQTPCPSPARAEPADLRNAARSQEDRFNMTPVYCGSLASVHGHTPACPHHVSASRSTARLMLFFCLKSASTVL